MTMRMKVYRVTATGERQTVREETVVKEADRPIAAGFPACLCPRCKDKVRHPSERNAS
jgi:hypothetical protein